MTISLEQVNEILAKANADGLPPSEGDPLTAAFDALRQRADQTHLDFIRDDEVVSMQIEGNSLTISMDFSDPRTLVGVLASIDWFQEDGQHPSRYGPILANAGAALYARGASWAMNDLQDVESTDVPDPAAEEG